MTRRHRHALALALLVAAGIGWHIGYGGATGLAAAVALLAAHLVAAALGYWLLRRRTRTPARQHAEAEHPVHDRAAESAAYDAMPEHPFHDG